MEILVAKLKDLLEQYHITNYVIAKNTSISQSHLSMIFHLKRSIKPWQFYAIVGQIPMPLNQKNALIDEFDKLYYSESEYMSKKHIHEMLRRLSNLTSRGMVNTVCKEKPIYTKTGYSDTVYRGTDIEIVINRLIGNFFAKSGSCAYVYLDCGSSGSILRGCIDLSLKKYENSAVFVIFTNFINDTQKTHLNLETLKTILPFALSDNTDSYEFYYTNVNSQITDNYSTPYPYFIALDEAVIFVSADSSEIMLCTEKKVVESVRTRCEGLKKHYNKLIDANSSLAYMIQTVIDNNDPSECFCSLEYEPCFAMQFTEELVKAVIPPEAQYKEIICAMGLKRLAQLKGFKKSIQIFNRNSIENFAKTGRINELPPEYVRNLTPEERVFILNNLLDMAKKSGYRFHALNPINLQLSESVSLYQNGDFVQFSIWANDEIPYKCCCILEKSVCESINSYLEYLASSDFVYSQKETIEIIENAIKSITV